MASLRMKKKNNNHTIILKRDAIAARKNTKAMASLRMKKKNKRSRVGVVYSTDPDFVYEHEDDQSPEPELRLPQQQDLWVHLDRKKRKGKEVTLVSRFVGPVDDLKILAKLLKTKCSVGGSIKDGVILIQGDHRDKVLLLLKNEGYTRSKKSG